jgi:hypothetical protein
VEPDQAAVSNEALREMVSSLAVTVDKLSVNVDRMVSSSELTRESLAKLSASNIVLASKNRQKLGVIVTLCALVIAAGVFGWRMEAQSTCFSNWANASTDRTGTLAALSTARSLALRKTVDAEHTALHFALTHPGGSAADTATLIADLGAWDVASASYQRADDAYAKAASSNPVPTSPKFRCTAF